MKKSKQLAAFSARKGPNPMLRLAQELMGQSEKNTQGFIDRQLTQAHEALAARRSARPVPLFGNAPIVRDDSNQTNLF